jgi:hypothetical protein
MISVIVCSVDNNRRSVFAEQLKQTIGIAHELIIIENDLEKLSISAAYNKGAALAAHPFLCFVHEDVTFHTDGWGPSFVHACQQAQAGFLGLAGSTLKTRTPSPWWITHSNPLADRFRRFHFIQSGVTQSQLSGHADLLEEVLCLDGFFLFCSKVTWEMTGFDQENLTNFHFYDMDICLVAHRKGLKNFVYAGCWIEHHSSGTLNKGWIKSAESFKKKWNDYVPVSLEPVSGSDLHELERLSLMDYINALISNGYLILSLKYLARLLTYGSSPEGSQVFKRYIKTLLHLQSEKNIKAV